MRCAIIAAVVVAAGSASGQIYITEWAYSVDGGEFVELTNVGNLIDRLTYGDEVFVGSIRTQGPSGNPISAAALTLEIGNPGSYIPAPASAALLGLGGLVAGRRNRSFSSTRTDPLLKNEQRAAHPWVARCCSGGQWNVRLGQLQPAL